MNTEDLSLSNIIINKIITSPEQYLFANQPNVITSNSLFSNRIIATMLNQLPLQENISDLFQLIPCNEVKVSRLFSPENIQIICTLWRNSLKVLEINNGNFKDVIFSGNSFQQLQKVRIDYPENLHTSQLLDLCKLLPKDLQEFTITHCDGFDHEVLKQLVFHCPNLEILQMDECKQISSIADITLNNLCVLDVSDTNIDTISNWKLGKLISLNFSNTKITDTDLIDIATSCNSTLLELDISNCSKITSFNDQLKELKILDIFGTAIPLSSLSLEILSLSNKYGETLLHQACIKRNPTLAKAFINEIEKLDSHKAMEILRKQDNNGQTVCMLALEKNLDDISSILIEKLDAHDLAIQCHEGATVLHEACFNKQEELAEKIILKINKLDSKFLSIPTTQGVTPLYLAIRKRLEKIARILVEQADLETIKIQNTANGYTALHIAIYKKRPEIVYSLLEKSDIKLLGIQTHELDTALHLALHYDLKDIAKHLIQSMDPNDLLLENNEKASAFYLALKKQQFDLAVMILEKIHAWNPQESQKILTKKTPQGHTILHMGIAFGLVDFSKSLIECIHVADLEIQGNNTGFTVLHLACDKEQDELAKILIEKISTADHETQRKIFKMHTKNYDTALTLAIKRKLTDVAHLLLTKMEAFSSPEDFVIIETE